MTREGWRAASRACSETPGSIAHACLGDLVITALSDLPADLDDGVNAVCQHCEHPELFCDCPVALKRVLDGWD